MSVEYFAPGAEGAQREGEQPKADEASGSASAPADQPWGAPPGSGSAPQTQAEKIRTAVIAVVAAIVIIGGGIAFANAASSGSSSSGPGGQGFPGGNNQGGYGGQVGFDQGAGTTSGGVSALMNALHGDFVASDGNNGYVTQRYQKGKVTAVSSTSLTVKSDDGYSQTYVVNDQTAVGTGNNKITDVRSGHTVTIIATVSGTTATAKTITDSDLQSGSDQGNGAQSGGQGDFPGQGAPSGNRSARPNR
jgi:hypothetical protein